MKRTLKVVAVITALFSIPVIGLSAEWTTAYACLKRTSYQSGEPVAPPFAVAWEYTGGEELLCAPLVAMDRAYLTTKAYHVSSLNLADGKVVWSFNGPRGLDEIVSFDAVTGKVRWRYQLDAPMVHTPQIGHAMVYAGTTMGTLYAYDQNKGTCAWWKRLGGPLTLASADATLMAVGSGTALVGLNPADGATMFRTELGAVPATFPVVETEGAFVALPNAVIATDRSGVIRWNVPSAKPITSPLVVTVDGVLVGSADGTVKLLKRTDGSVVWETILAGTPHSLSGAAGTLYVGTREGTLVGLRLADGAKLWSAALGHGAVTGVALAGGRLLVTAASWTGALVPAPEAPTGINLKRAGKSGVLAWTAPAPNGSAISAYRVWRKRGSMVSQAGVVPANSLSFSESLLPGEVSYEVSAIAVNGAESTHSSGASLVKGEELLKGLSVAPLPFDPKKGPLEIGFVLATGARVSWDVVDAEGTAVIDERTAQLPKGMAALSWDGICRDGRPVERGTMKVRVRATADGEDDAEAKVFPVEWKTDTHQAGPQGGPANAGGGSASGSASAASGGSSSAPNPGGASSTQPGSVDNGNSGHTNNGVRDHGVGEGRDGAGQGKGQGADNGKK
jgi:outer membrane protein assembly factor BamB